MASQPTHRPRKSVERGLRRAGTIWAAVALVAGTHLERGVGFVLSAFSLFMLGVVCVFLSAELAVRRRRRRGDQA